MGGTTPSRSDRRLITASAAPAPAIMWPVTPLVDVTGGGASPKTLRIASASVASLSGVDVPCAFTCPMSALESSPASSSASCMHAAAPAPPGTGAVMWCASALRP